jgi:nucleotide-binding universal stress UspA family protein
MAIRRLLVPIDGTEPGRAAMALAIAVARRLGSHIDGLHVHIEPIEALPIVGEGVSGALIQELIELTAREATGRAAAAKRIFDEVQAEYQIPLLKSPHANGASAWWSEVMGREDEVIARLGRLADMIVVSRPSPKAEVGASLAFDTALFETGRPVLVAPREAPGDVGHHIAVAWNDSAESSRALAASLPLLRTAARVTVVAAVSGDVDQDECRAVVDYLHWHGVAAEERVVLGHGAVGDALIEGCGDADLIVMGAYTHSRLLQLILGGVTRHLLEEARVPLLMAH